MKFTKTDPDTHAVETTDGLYEIQREGTSWGLYREGSRFAPADSLAEAKELVRRSVAEAKARGEVK